MPIHASLGRLHIQTPDPEGLAAFYARAYGMGVTALPGMLLCAGPQRRVSFAPGSASQLHYALFHFALAEDFARFAAALPAQARIDVSAYQELPEGALALRDPDGTLLVFIHRPEVQPAAPAGAFPEAVTQHFALRTTQIETMLDFYTAVAGFTLSDRVEDGEGKLRACFLRANEQHHTLALFAAAQAGFDHQSLETPSWDDLKHWADHVAQERIPIAWGVGRHGPGNDVFFMVRDPDGNLAEISAELEICAEDRPAGIWPHEQRTLNLWGAAILRS